MSWLLKMTFLVAAVMLIAHCYISWRTYRLIKGFRGRSWNYLLFLIFVSFYIYPLYGLGWYFLSADIDLLTFWQPMSYWFWFGLIFSVHLFSWLLILDIIKLFVQFLSGLNQTKIETLYSWIFGLMTGIILAFTAIKMIHDTSRIQINKVSYTSKRVPRSADNFRIVHISDIHGDEYTGQEEIADYVKKINALHPDLIVFTGDLISYGTDFINMAARELGHANAIYGTYAVIGDHDYWAGVSHIERALTRQGVHVLQDRNTFIRIKNDSLLLTGITEVYSKHIPRDSLQLLTEAYPHASLKVLATHQATEKVIHQTQKEHYQLLLGGHTHGGQLRIPFLFMTFSAAELDTPYLSGTFTFGNMLMNINNGLGFTLAPVRYNAPPTISVIDLSSE